jgi:hypothetical protein
MRESPNTRNWEKAELKARTLEDESQSAKARRPHPSDIV